MSDLSATDKRVEEETRNVRRREKRIRRWKRPFAIGAVLCLVVIACVFGLRWLIYNRTHQSTDDAQVEADIYPVSPRISGHVLRVYVSEHQRVRAGQVLLEIDPTDYELALREAEATLTQVQNSASAAATTVSFTEETSAAGVSEALARVDSVKASELTAERQSESAAGQVEAARAEEQAAKGMVEAARQGIVAAAASLRGAQARAEKANNDAARFSKLFEAGAVSAQQYDAAVAERDGAKADLEAAQAQVESSQANLIQAQGRYRQAVVGISQAVQRAAAATAQVSQAKAEVRQAQAGLHSAESSILQTKTRRSEANSAYNRVIEAQRQLEQARINLSRTRVVAPVDGVIGKKNVEPGQFVQPGQSLVSIFATASTHVTANFKETQMHSIKPGQRASFTVDTYPGVTFSGRVESISPGTGAVFSLLPPENATGNFTKVVQRIPVRIAVDRCNGRKLPTLRAGMSAVVSVGTS